MKFILVAILVLVIGNVHSESVDKDVPPIAGKTKASNKGGGNSNPTQEVTVNLPSAIDVTVSGKIEAVSEQKKTSADQESSKWTDPSTLLSLLLVAANIALWWTTRDIAKEAKSASITAAQSAAATNVLASATESLAIGANERFAKQMRAWLSVTIHKGASQTGERTFGAAPQLLNTGFTPAFNVHLRLACEVHPVPLPPNFDFSRAIYSELGGTLGPHQHWELNGIVADRFSDDDVALIRTAHGRAVYMWGTITYDDASGKQRTTEFCHRMTYPSTGGIYGFYESRHSRMT